jgi:phospholipid/cholesterol/gamma-HCH transport system substrate-binding protein
MQEGLIGTSIIDISVGSPDLPRLKREEDGRRFIHFRRQEALNDIAMEMRDSVNNLFHEIHKTISYINDPQGEIKRTLANVERLTAGLEQTRGNADRLLLSGAATADKSALLIDNLNVMAGNLSTVADNTSQRLPAMMDKVEKTLANVENSSMHVRNMTETATPRITPILHETEDLVSNTNDILGAVKRMWPVRNHMPEKDMPEIVPGDSHE